MLATQRQQQPSPFKIWTLYCHQPQNREFHLNQIGIRLGYVSPGNRNQLNPQARAAILQHIIYKLGWELPQEPLSWLIFGKELIEQWTEIDKQHYPHYQLILAVKPGEEGLMVSCHHQPLWGAPRIDNSQCDFSWEAHWDNLEYFWGEYPGNTSNILELEWNCYPDEFGFGSTKLMSKSELAKSWDNATEAIALAGHDINKLRASLEAK